MRAEFSAWESGAFRHALGKRKFPVLLIQFASLQCCQFISCKKRRRLWFAMRKLFVSTRPFDWYSRYWDIWIFGPKFAKTDSRYFCSYGSKGKISQCQYHSEGLVETNIFPEATHRQRCILQYCWLHWFLPARFAINFFYWYLSCFQASQFYYYWKFIFQSS